MVTSVPVNETTFWKNQLTEALASLSPTYHLWLSSDREGNQNQCLAIAQKRLSGYAQMWTVGTTTENVAAIYKAFADELHAMFEEEARTVTETFQRNYPRTKNVKASRAQQDSEFGPGDPPLHSTSDDYWNKGG